MTIIYKSPGNDARIDAVVKARMTADSALIDWEVEMEPVDTKSDGVGKEIIV